MKKVLILLSLCILFSLTETLSNDNIVQRNKELILKTKIQSTSKEFFGILLVPYIICFFAATGIWPHFPQYMQGSVNEMGQQIFSQSDDQIRTFCRGKFLFNAQHSYRPIFLKGIFFPTFIKELSSDPVTEMTHRTVSPTKEMTQITMKEETKQSTQPITSTESTTVTEPPVVETTTTTTEATTIAETVLTTLTTVTEAITTAETTTAPPSTTEPDVGVITFDPMKTPSPCNCSQPKLIKHKVDLTTVKIEKIIRTTPPTTSTPHTGNITLEVKNVISLIDLILSYLNVTRSNP